jgi:hypothetical protein
METETRESLKRHLIRDILQQKQKFSIGTKQVNGNGHLTALDKPVLTENRSELLSEGFPEFPQLIDVQVLHLPADDGTDPSKFKAVNVPGGALSTFYKTMSNINLRNGEINLAAVQGQFFGTAYTNPEPGTAEVHSNYSCGSISKTIQLNEGRGYGFNVLVVATAEFALPDDASLVYNVEPGNLNLSIVGVKGTIRNTITYLNDRRWSSGTAQRTFLQAVRSDAGSVASDIYLKRFTEQWDITIGHGVKEFHHNVFASINAFTSMNIRNADGLDTSNYGLAMIDLRGRLNGNETPIATYPIAGGFKAAPGGIRLTSVQYEIFKME